MLARRRVFGGRGIFLSDMSTESEVDSGELREKFISLLKELAELEEFFPETAPADKPLVVAALEAFAEAKGRHFHRTHAEANQILASLGNRGKLDASLWEKFHRDLRDSIHNILGVSEPPTRIRRALRSLRRTAKQLESGRPLSTQKRSLGSLQENQDAVLAAIRERGPSRNFQIAADTGLSKSVVSRAIDALIDQGMVDQENVNARDRVFLLSPTAGKRRSK